MCWGVASVGLLFILQPVRCDEDCQKTNRLVLSNQCLEEIQQDACHCSSLSSLSICPPWLLQLILTRFAQPHVHMYMFCPCVSHLYTLLVTLRIQMKTFKRYFSQHAILLTMKRFTQPRVHTCSVLLSSLPFTCYLKSHNCKFPKDTFSSAPFSQLYTSEKWIKIPLLFITTVFHRALASCCSRKIE
jgi:hypothetical protein